MYSCTGGCIPCVLLDGHGSRFGIPSLDCICNPLHKWCIIIGVHYGTTLWQVGDSPEQNGSLNTTLAKEKQHIVKEKEKRFLQPNIEPYEIIFIVSVAWDKLFARVDTNKNAISEQG